MRIMPPYNMQQHAILITCGHNRVGACGHNRVWAPLDHARAGAPIDPAFGPGDGYRISKFLCILRQDLEEASGIGSKDAAPPTQICSQGLQLRMQPLR